MKGYERTEVFPGPVDRIPSEPLRRASRDVLESWPQGPGQPGPARISSELVRLSRAIEGIKHGDDLSDTDFDPALLSQVRAQLLEQQQEASGGPDWASADVAALEVLRASRPSEADDPLGLLREPDGFQLVVEMAHDLRSPLSSILFLSETLRRGQSGETNELQRRQLGLIYSAAFGLARVMNDVVELAKGCTTLRDESEQPFSVIETVHSVLELVGPIAEEKGLTLTSEVDGVDYVRGYPISVSRVLLNLTTNALQHTSVGGVAVSVRRCDRNEIELSVADTGSGIEESAKGGLFRPFKQAHDGNRMMFSGTGLGLSIARGLVEAMGGTLGFDTQVGEGTRFWFRVPVSTH